ncbi:hypothetical protein HanPSC8_Chr04g0162431 [Helianthus annuus]|nr:hypothetical protein HanPSC8_Chr04g0162431 [Helianthus annuus]
MQPTPSLLHHHQHLHPGPSQHHHLPAWGSPQHHPHPPGLPALPSNLQRPTSFCQR